MTVTKQVKRIYNCAKCGRRLKRDRYIYSHHTGSRYCWPGQGCGK